MKITEKLSVIQAEFKANKSRYNSFGKYNFRSAEDILEALKPFNSKYKVYFTVSEEMIATDPLPIMKSTAAIHDADGGMSVECSAIVGVDLQQKGMQVPQQFGSASSYAKKYALGNLLLIDDTQDSDATNTHGRGEKTKVTLTAKTDPAFKKAVEYVKSGGSVDNIKKKYALSKEVEAELMTL
jgi:hypothetical protein